MKGKPLSNLSANALQLIINQVFGLVIFYILSTGLNKITFGQINLALAVLLAVFNILSFGIDQVAVKKIAAGDDKHALLSLYIVHVIVTGLLFYGLLLIGLLFLPNLSAVYSLVLLIGIGKAMIYFSTPFKQAANGMERFKLLAYMSVVSNFVRCAALVVFAVLHMISLPVIVAIFIVGDVAELGICVILFRRIGVPLTIKWSKTEYIKLLRESLPQTGVVLITSALARFDWLFIGFILSAIKLAEYSFAYKIFEISTLPLLAIAPLLIPRFTKIFKQDVIPVYNLRFLIRMELIIAAVSVLVLNMCWAPVIDGITAGKYGLVNVTTIFILSLCIPLLYLNNFFWTIYFAQGRLKMILNSFIITLAVNVLGDVVLIPFYKNEGAAFAFLLACIAQSIFYLRQNTIAGLGTVWQPLVWCVASALASGFAAKTLFPDSYFALPAAIVLYIVLLVITRQLKLADKTDLKAILN